jgi:hypothetical protein
MPLNSSGQISLGGPIVGESINLELGQTSTTLVSLDDPNVRSLAGVPSGTISMPTNFYGKSSFQGWILTYTYNVDPTTTSRSQFLSYDYTNNIAHFMGTNFTGNNNRGYWSSYNVLSNTYNWQRGIQSTSALFNTGEVSAISNIGPGQPYLIQNNGVYWMELNIQNSGSTVRSVVDVVSSNNLSTGNIISNASGRTVITWTGMWTRNLVGPPSGSRPYFTNSSTSFYAQNVFPSNNDATTFLRQTAYVSPGSTTNYRYGYGEYTRENSTGNFYIYGQSRQSASSTRRPTIMKANSVAMPLITRVITGSTQQLSSSGNFNNARNQLVVAYGNGFALMDTNLNFVGTTACNVSNTSIVNYGIYLDDDGSIYLLHSNNTNFPNLLFLTKFSSSFSVIWQRSFSISTANTFSMHISNVDNEAIYIQFNVVMQTTAGGPISYPWLWRLPKDGGKTGTYTIGGASVTYAVATGPVFSIVGLPTMETGPAMTNLGTNNEGTSTINTFFYTAAAGTNIFRPTF